MYSVSQLVLMFVWGYHFYKGFRWWDRRGYLTRLRTIYITWVGAPSEKGSSGWTGFVQLVGLMVLHTEFFPKPLAKSIEVTLFWTVQSMLGFLLGGFGCWFLRWWDRQYR